MPHEVIMPMLGMAQDTGVVLAWHRSIGDAVTADDILFDVETDKATVEVAAGTNGYITELRVAPGTTVPVGEVIAIISAEAVTPTPEVEPSPMEPAAQSDSHPNPSPATTVAAAQLVEPGSPREPSIAVDGFPSRVLASPKAKRLAVERNVDLHQLVDGGIRQPITAKDIFAWERAQPAGRDLASTRPERNLASDLNASPAVRAYARRQGVDIVALAHNLNRRTIGHEDVERALMGAMTSRPNQPMDDLQRPWQVDHTQYGSVTVASLSPFRRQAIRNLAAAHALIPTVTHHDLADVRALDDLRHELQPAACTRGVKLTALPFHLLVLARLLREFPDFNASLSADGEALVRKQYVHIGIATNAPHGLVIPVVRNVNQMNLWGLAAELSRLTDRARSRKIAPTEIGGASMTISNLGSIGGTGFTPIVNPPEVAILGLSRVALHPHWNGEKFVPVPTLPLALSYDHRVINGADAAQFLRRYSELILAPRILVE